MSTKFFIYIFIIPAVITVILASLALLFPGVSLSLLQGLGSLDSNVVSSPIADDSILITNPVYLVAPSGLLIDTENIISNNPEDNKSVWVEEVIDPDTIKVSYIILKGGERILTFRVIKLAGLCPLAGSCRINQATGFLKKFIEHKYIYLHTPKNYVNLRDDLIKYAYILKEDVDTSLFDISVSTSNELDIGISLVITGYARTCGLTSDFYYESRLKNEEEVAQVAKRGFWGTCN